ncbi:hypothetical protein [Chitinophaga sp. sic0106]|uniref:hypothetical protein n=1 Tax=Chitinophaga sp. sic0106 TaxID=2854785 RepID=UPI001C48DEF8|nr:hypothetical protein [Chitinophaga sp. sic0106]MBV7532724.1 hypothetical protein [Chitinophaga sp. sic0106]
MRRKHNGMRPQDIAVLLKVIILGDKKWQLKDLANALFISISEISESLERSQFAQLIDHTKRKVHRQNLMDFLLYGLKYVFPLQPGVLTRGIPTAHSHPFMKQFISSEAMFVWPSVDGEVIGQAIEPLYPNQIQAIGQDDELYKLLALVDVIRVGKRREVEVAAEELKTNLKVAAGSKLNF